MIRYLIEGAIEALVITTCLSIFTLATLIVFAP